MNPRKTTVAIYIHTGSEIKAFLYSDVFHRLRASANVIVLSDVNSPTIKSFCHQYSAMCIILAEEKVSVPLYSVLSSSVKSRLKALGYGIYSHLKSFSSYETYRDKLKGNRFVFYLVKWCFTFINSRTVLRPQLEQTLGNYGVKKVLMLNAYSPNAMALLFTCDRLKVMTFALQNSFKDFYINPFLSDKLDVFFTWSRSYAKKYQRVNWLNRKPNLVASGHPAFELAKGYRPKQPLAYYAQKYNISDEDGFVFYTAVNPSVYNRESSIILTVLDAIRELNPSLKLLIRVNPMDDINVFENLRQSAHIRIMENYWSYNSHHNQLSVEEEDIHEYFDLLYYCKCVINVPSTVTVEAQLLKVPVINICFDHNGDKSEHFSSIFHSPFYRDLHNDNLFVSYSPTDLKAALVKIFEMDNRPHTLINPLVLDEDSNSVEVIVDQIIKG